LLEGHLRDSRDFGAAGRVSGDTGRRFAARRGSMPSRRHGMAAVALFCLCATAAADQAPAVAVDSPEATVRSLHRALVEVSGRMEADDPQFRYQRLAPVIEATHDLPYIAEFTVRRQWGRFDAKQREAFIRAFERLSIMTYVARFSRVDKKSLVLRGSNRLESGRAEVSAAIVRSDATEVPIEYVLHQRDEGWRIVNIVADGVSDLALKRAEYQRVLSDGSPEDLVRYVEDQAAALEADAAQRTKR
jgi:phospholipid transport system substrate-binding protein